MKTIKKYNKTIKMYPIIGFGWSGKMTDLKKQKQKTITTKI